MGIYKSHKRQFQLKNANKIRLEKHQKNLLLQEQSASTNEVSTNEATNKVSTNKAATNEVSTEHNRLTLMIHKLPKKDILPATNLISIMKYPKGPNLGDIISPYLQRKMYNYLIQTLYKRQVSHQSLKESNVLLEKNKKLHQKNTASCKTNSITWTTNTI
ncbi:hypothetical protein C2G38_2217721 [Gigaspora rosea]|uniref:Uncharacterized protein n=1 Tax=Gigaspora rosea TaxID=44941 RepID=A0A397UBQ4_9GLOM|nr:hypothetical protein C2G38_2217721 [Gigaspora rosea]